MYTYIHVRLYTYIHSACACTCTFVHCTHTLIRIHVQKQDDDPPPLEELSNDSMAPQPQPNDLRQSNGTGQEDSETGVLFPLEHLAKLDDQLNRPKWVVPVRPDDDLERLLKASIKLCREGGFESYSIVLEFIYMYVGGRVQQFL